MAVADGLAHHDYVWRDALRFESPEVCADSPVAGLHFVGDADAARFAHVAVNVGQITFGEENLAAHAGTGFGDVTGDADAALAESFNNFQNVSRVFFSRLRIVGFVRAAINIGDWSGVNPRRSAFA